MRLCNLFLAALQNVLTEEIKKGAWFMIKEGLIRGQGAVMRALTWGLISEAGAWHYVHCTMCHWWPVTRGAPHWSAQRSNDRGRSIKIVLPRLLVLKVYFLPLLHDYHILSTRILMALSIGRQLVFNRTDKRRLRKQRWKVFFQKILTKYGTEVQDHISNLTDRHSSGLRFIYIWLD